MEPDFYLDTYNNENQNDGTDGGNELVNIIQKIDSMEIVYSQPEIKYRVSSCLFFIKQILRYICNMQHS